MNCSKCGKSITQDQSYVNKGKVYCDDCLMDIGLTMKECDPWATYVDKRTQKLDKKSVSLTAAEQKVFDYIKSKGKATRQDVAKSLKLTDSELQVQLVPLLHFDLLKETSDKSKMYLVLPEQAKAP